jgi:hypothetical protein
MLIHESEYLLKTGTISSTRIGQGYNKEAAFFIVLFPLVEKGFFIDEPVKRFGM